MNIRNVTYALIAALIYETFFKLVYFLDPGIISSTFVSAVSKVLSFAVGIIVILFLYYFYKQEKSHKHLAVMMKALIIVFMLQYMMRLSGIQNLFSNSSIQLSRSILNVAQSLILFISLILLIKFLPAEPKKLKESAVVLSVFFGIGIAKNIYMLILYIRYLESGFMLQVDQTFHLIFFVIFLLFHLSLIWFLFTYMNYKHPSTKEGLTQ